MQCLAERPQPNMDFAHEGVDDHLAHLGQPDQRGFLVDAWPVEMLRQKAQCAASNGLAFRSSNARGKGSARLRTETAAHRVTFCGIRKGRGLPRRVDRSRQHQSLQFHCYVTGRTGDDRNAGDQAGQATRKPLRPRSSQNKAPAPQAGAASQREQAQRRPQHRDDGEQRRARIPDTLPCVATPPITI